MVIPNDPIVLTIAIPNDHECPSLHPGSSAQLLTKSPLKLYRLDRSEWRCEWWAKLAISIAGECTSRDSLAYFFALANNFQDGKLPGILFPKLAKLKRDDQFFLLLRYHDCPCKYFISKASCFHRSFDCLFYIHLTDWQVSLHHNQILKIHFS